MNEPLIDDLVEDLEPVSPPAGVGVSALAWMAGSWVLVAVCIALSGPVREGAFAQLATPRFLLECLLGLALGGVAMLGALSIATPGRGRAVRLAAPGLALLGVWAAAYLVGLASPALAPSGAGYRSGCFLQILLFALPPLAWGVFLVRRRAALAPGPATGLAAIAAASLPALAMQLACMYDPLHTLAMHLSPLLLLGGAAAALGARLLRPI